MQPPKRFVECASLVFELQRVCLQPSAEALRKPDAERALRLPWVNTVSLGVLLSALNGATYARPLGVQSRQLLGGEALRTSQP